MLNNFNEFKIQIGTAFCQITSRKGPTGDQVRETVNEFDLVVVGAAFLFISTLRINILVASFIELC